MRDHPQATKNDQTHYTRLSAGGRFDRSNLKTRWQTTRSRGSAVGGADIGNSDFPVKHFFEKICHSFMTVAKALEKTTLAAYSPWLRAIGPGEGGESRSAIASRPTRR